MTTDVEVMLVATTEVLWWAMALDERLGRDVDDYKSDRNAHPNMKDTALGLRHARNRLGHQLTEAIRVSTQGMSFPAVFPLVFHEMFWIGRAEVDQGVPAGHLNRRDGDAYERALAGRMVRVTVPSFTEWLLTRPEVG